MRSRISQNTLALALPLLVKFLTIMLCVARGAEQLGEAADSRPGHAEAAAGPGGQGRLGRSQTGFPWPPRRCRRSQSAGRLKSRGWTRRPPELAGSRPTADARQGPLDSVGPGQVEGSPAVLQGVPPRGGGGSDGDEQRRCRSCVVRYPTTQRQTGLLPFAYPTACICVAY